MSRTNHKLLLDWARQETELHAAGAKPEHPANNEAEVDFTQAMKVTCVL